MLLRTFEDNVYCFDGEDEIMTVSVPLECGIDNDEELNIQGQMLFFTG